MALSDQSAELTARAKNAQVERAQRRAERREDDAVFVLEFAYAAIAEAELASAGRRPMST